MFVYIHFLYVQSFFFVLWALRSGFMPENSTRDALHDLLKMYALDVDIVAQNYCSIESPCLSWLHLQINHDCKKANF